ncbi:uncharacterized protein [Phyllobates terribilis]|uniref:uncharacterized protein n=1 Tax=Phyllobates terribilis TaxID=111132 RepID=UPI003CCB1612
MLEAIKYMLGSTGSSGFGSKSTAEDVTGDLRHITAIITGATSGIGAETARVLAKRGARLVLPARSYKAAEEARARILAEIPAAQVIVMALDLSSLASVRKFVREFESMDLPLNLLISNAGKFSHQHAISEDGIEMTFATNYLGHFLLTKLLMTKMAETAKETGVQGRVVNVTSGIHTWFSGDMFEYLKLITKSKSDYDATRAYSLSKLANVLHTKELSRKFKEMEANVSVNCVHPGIVRTRITRDREGLITDLVFFLASKFLKTIPQGAATTCYVATHPRVKSVTGKYFADCNETFTPRIGDVYEAERLWSVSESMVDETKDSKSVEDIGCLRRENRWFLIVISLLYRDNSCSLTFLAVSSKSLEREAAPGATK